MTITVNFQNHWTFPLSSQGKYAIIEIGGMQKLVEEGQYHITNRLKFNEGSSFFANHVALCNDYGDRIIVRPYIEKEQHIKVRCTILEHLRGPKLTILKMVPKKKRRWKHGYRQEQTLVLIEKILPNTKG